jgi:hypothetical protein
VLSANRAEANRKVPVEANRERQPMRTIPRPGRNS